MTSISNSSDTQGRPAATLGSRVEHFTWAWFTLPLSTAGVALMLAATPHRFDGLATIGKIFFVFALVLFVAAASIITTRFVLYRHTIHCSFVHPTESLFFPTAILSLANLLGCAQIYGSPELGTWYATAMRVLFWMYIAIAFITSSLQYLHLFMAHPAHLTIQSMTPAWILPIFPMMLGGVVASIIAPGQPPMSCLTIIIAGITSLGLGWMVAFLMYAIFLHRLMQFGLPAPNLRPGMFITVGPPTFAGLALINFGNALPIAEDVGYFASNDAAIEILHTMGDFIAIFLWLFGAWFFCVTLLAVVAGIRQMSFHLIWWALVFPNVAFVIATGRVGEQLESEGIMWIASIMAILLVGMWLFVFVLNMRAVFEGDIMMAGKDEDKECHKEDDEKQGVMVPEHRIS